ncbi:hypothetical protein, partial [Devosia indica]
HSGTTLGTHDGNDGATKVVPRLIPGGLVNRSGFAHHGNFGISIVDGVANYLIDIANAGG